MHWLTKDRQLSACVGLFAVYTLVSVVLHRSPLLTNFADLYQFFLTLLAVAVVQRTGTLGGSKRSNRTIRR